MPRREQDSGQTATQPGMSKLNAQLEEFGLVAIESAEKESENFKIDNGSTAHITPFFEDFVEYTAFTEPRSVKGIDLGKASGMGRIRVQSVVKDSVYEFDLNEVLYIKTAPFRVLSELAAEDRGCRFEKMYTKDGYGLLCGFIDGKLRLASSRKIGEKMLYRTTVSVVSGPKTNSHNTVEPNVSLMADT